MNRFNKGGLLEDCLKELSEVSFKYDHIAINDFIHKYGSYEELSYNSGFSDKNIYKIAKKLISKKMISKDITAILQSINNDTSSHIPNTNKFERLSNEINEIAEDLFSNNNSG